MSRKTSASSHTTPTFEVNAATQMAAVHPCVGVSAEALNPQDLLRLAINLNYTQICQKQGLAFDTEKQSAEALVQSPESFFEFPIASIFKPQDVRRVTERGLVNLEENFSSSAQKQPVLERLTKMMESKGIGQTFTDDVVAIADEMFTNAIFNAPFVNQQTQHNPGVSRQDVEVALSGGKHARFFTAEMDQRILIGCEDPFGSLNIVHYLNKIKATYDRGAAATMNFGSGGAGLGSYIIFNSGCSLYFGVRPGHATIICCLLPLGMSGRKRVQLPKHLHWIQL